MKHFTIFFLSIFLSLSSVSQTLLFKKDKKEYGLWKNTLYAFVMKNGVKYTSQIDSFTVNTISINTIEVGPTTLKISEIKAYKQRRHWWYIGRYASLISFWKTRDLEGFAVSIKPRRE